MYHYRVEPNHFILRSSLNIATWALEFVDKSKVRLNYII